MFSGGNCLAVKLGNSVKSHFRTRPAPTTQISETVGVNKEPQSLTEIAISCLCPPNWRQNNSRITPSFLSSAPTVFISRTSQSQYLAFLLFVLPTASLSFSLSRNVLYAAYLIYLMACGLLLPLRYNLARRHVTDFQFCHLPVFPIWNSPFFPHKIPGSLRFLQKWVER